MKKKNWFKNKIAALAIAFSNVEKNALGQNGEKSGDKVSQTRRSTEGQLMDSLVNGVMTEEVMNLRWRMYKTLAESEKYITKAEAVLNDNGELIGFKDVGTRKKDLSQALDKISVEPSDNYPLELVVENTEVPLSISDTMAGINGMTALELTAALKTERLIQVIREYRPKFDIENYTTKLHVRKISDTEKLLEFYVSKYPDEFNRTTRLFIGEIKKAITNPRLCNMLDLKEVGFLTYNSVGADNYLAFQYEIVNFDKIVEFNGEYVIKFKAKVLVDGENVLTKYIQEDLEDKYKNKVRR